MATPCASKAGASASARFLRSSGAASTCRPGADQQAPVRVTRRAAHGQLEAPIAVEIDDVDEQPGLRILAADFDEHLEFARQELGAAHSCVCARRGMVS